MVQMKELTVQECRRLLASDAVGRVAFATPQGPSVVPVNYRVLDDVVVIATAPQTELGRHGRDAVVAFEIDQVDYESGHGWSVVIRGRTEWLTDPEDLRRIDAAHPSWRPEPWPDGTRRMLLTIAMTEVSGRRLGWGWQPMAQLAR